jgi:predicted esterase
MSHVPYAKTILTALACVAAWAGAARRRADGPLHGDRWSALDGHPRPGTRLAGARGDPRARGRGPEQWKPFVASLHAAGYATLTYRSRRRQRLDEIANARDVAGAVAAMRERRGLDPQRIGVVGASIGATAVSYLSFLPAGRAVDAAVGLSPATFLDEPPPGRTPRDLLLIADSTERGAAELIAGSASTIEVRTAPVLGHGVALLADRRVREQVLDWLGDRLRPR